MYRALRTKYHPAGNVRGARISCADCEGREGVVYVDYPHEVAGGDNDTGKHRVALDAFLAKMAAKPGGAGWPMLHWVGGFVEPGVCVWVADYETTKALRERAELAAALRALVDEYDNQVFIWGSDDGKRVEKRFNAARAALARPA